MRTIVCAFATAVIFTGCIGDSGQQAIVSGKVTYQGEPVSQGSIRFVPLGGTKGPSSGAVIQDGVYEAKARGGVPLGEHRVEIKATRPTGEEKPEATKHLDIFPDPVEQYLPEKYNTKSEITLKVEKGGKMKHDFVLE